MGASTDIDIDFPDREAALKNVWHVPAVQWTQGKRDRHKSGVYFQSIPIDPADGCSVYDYVEAAERGYFKVDFLSNTLYKGIRDEQHLDELLAREPLWELFLEEDVLKHLSHVNGHIKVLRSIKPRSIEDLAVCLALIRPGKRYLIGRSRQEIDTEVWKPTVDYNYKKAHAIAYAASIVVQFNLLIESIL